MWNELFVGALGALFFAYLAWGFRRLPEEKWQIFATLPQRQDAAGYWQGLNFTYYGLLSSAAQFVSVAIIFLLFGAVGVSRAEIVLLSIVMLGACIPGSKIVALMVEKKSAVFSVGGAGVHRDFAGTVGGAAEQRHARPAAGQRGTGAAGAGRHQRRLRLRRRAGTAGVHSFGCCYGKPLHASHPLVQKLFARWHFVFRGETKKIAYAGNLAGEKVVPIQAVTATLYTGVGLAGMLLFLHGAYVIALLLTLAVTQLWRAFSETLRADWRGTGRFSVYQVLALLSVLYTAAVLGLLPTQTPVSASLLRGLETLWHPGMVLFLLGFWVATFLYYGRSLVTGSRLSLYVCHERIVENCLSIFNVRCEAAPADSTRALRAIPAAVPDSAILTRMQLVLIRHARAEERMLFKRDRSPRVNPRRPTAHAQGGTRTACASSRANSNSDQPATARTPDGGDCSRGLYGHRHRVVAGAISGRGSTRPCSPGCVRNRRMQRSRWSATSRTSGCSPAGC